MILIIRSDWLRRAWYAAWPYLLNFVILEAGLVIAMLVAEGSFQHSTFWIGAITGTVMLITFVIITDGRKGESNAPH